MAAKTLMKGNIALARGALLAGCTHYFGYPITPQNEIPEFMSAQINKKGGVYVQAESEVAAINMVFGASAAGARTMTTTSSPGFSLMQEGVSYIAAAHLPCVIANVQRGGPGLGNIAVAQADYFQATKGGGHGDYHLIVLAPSSPQEMMDLTLLAFELADRYRIPVLILSDAVIGQMMEAVTENDTYKPQIPVKSWALTGSQNRTPNVVRTLWLDETGVEINNHKLQEKYKLITEKEIRYEDFQVDDAEIVLVAYGLSARIARSVVLRTREEGIHTGLMRPISLWPFPYDRIRKIAENKAKRILVVEMSAGQMVEDVRLSVAEKVPVEFYGTMGGKSPSEDEIYALVKKLGKG
jgi:2-oxoglutarate/2-oxoacid ferredoxin oxidoreductase subunit alpha